MKRALVLSFTDLGRDPRVNRQIRFLARDFRVTAAGLGDPGIEGVEFLPLRGPEGSRIARALAAPLLVSGRYERYYWSRPEIRQARERLSGRQADLFVANDIEALPVVLEAAGKTPVLFDAHEYAPRQFEDLWRWRLLHRPFREYLCRTYIPRTAAMLTVCDTIAAAYARDTGVEPRVIWNAPEFAALEPSRGGADDGQVRLVHHGGAQRSRRLELMIDTLKALPPRFTLDFLLVPADPAYLQELRARAACRPGIRFLPPVPMRDLPRALNRYDAGIYILPPVNFNHQAALPNKFFEFVQARLAVGIGPSVEMKNLVERFGLGVVAEDFSPPALARALGGLDAGRIAAFKNRAHAAARELSAEVQEARFRAVIAGMRLGSSAANE